MQYRMSGWIISTALIFAACTSGTKPAPTATLAPRLEAQDVSLADVTAVRATGEPGAYRFYVEIRSPDRGCDQYADWWEIVTAEGELVYRRVLLHSHVDEQPFERSGGPVDVDPDTTLWIRAHMQPGGYGGQAFTGIVRTGFRKTVLDPAFAAGLSESPPLPESCAF